nr:uncharacterized protein LOC107282008 [Oryza sativa Japonica Group]
MQRKWHHRRGGEEGWHGRRGRSGGEEIDRSVPHLANASTSTRSRSMHRRCTCRGAGRSCSVMFVLVQALVYHILRSSSSVFSKDSKLGGAATRRRRHGRRGGRRQGEVASTGERGGGGRRGGDGGRRARLRMGSSGADDFAPLSLIVVGGSRRGRRTPLIGDGDRDHRAAGFSSLVRWAAAPHSRRPHACRRPL